jgi:hypothetical protein
MIITQFRDEFGKDYTLSTIVVGNFFRCYALEDVDRYLELHPEAKVHGQTAIPRGEYRVQITDSTRFKKPLIQLMDVPGFRGIRVHPGNRPEDTEGCILPGLSKSTRWVRDSKRAYQVIHDIVAGLLAQGADVRWRVE